MVTSQKWETILLITLTALFLKQSKAENINDVQRLLDDIFAAPKYNKLIRGVSDQTETVKINVSFSIVAIVNLNEVEETLELMGVLRIIWYDERLVWDPARYNNTQSVHVFQNNVWKPEIVLANPAKPVSLFGHERIMIAYYSNGTACWIIGKRIWLSMLINVNGCFPAGTWRLYNVALTSWCCIDVLATLSQCCLPTGFVLPHWKLYAYPCCKM